MGVAVSPIGDWGGTDSRARVAPVETLPGCVVSRLSAPQGAGRGRDHRTGCHPDDNLRELCDELGVEAVDRLVASYLALLGGRVDDVGQCLRSKQYEAGSILLLTLETSSHLVGADDLSRVAVDLRLAIEQDRGDSTDELYCALRRSASVARTALSSWLAASPSQPGGSANS